MANWKLGKIQYGLVETATSGGTLTLSNNSKQFQILTGSSNHNVKLPDATTIGVGTGVAFIVSNQSTGIITVQYNDASTLTTVTAGSSVELLLTNSGTTNGVWRIISSSGAPGGLSSVAPGSAITTNYTVVAGDDGRTLNVDTSSTAITITLPAPVAGFKVTVKDYKGNAATNNITVKRNGSELIDNSASDDTINVNYTAVSFVSDGTDWYRIVSFTGIAPFTPGRALFAGGSTGSDSAAIDYIAIASTGNGTSFGNLSVARHYLSGCASATRGLFGGGTTGSPSLVIDYVTIGTLGNATNFGNLTVARWTSSCSSSTRGIWGGGYDNSVYRSEIDYVTIATTGNATSFGSLTQARQGSGSFASTTRGVFGGGDNASSPLTTIDYITIASTGNATSFGSLSVGRQELSGCSNATRGLFGGGYTGATSAVIDYVTIATTGNATSFGNLSVARHDLAGTASPTRGVFGGGNVGGTPQNTIDYVTIATTGNATSFGTLTSARLGLGACSNVHGGI